MKDIIAAFIFFTRLPLWRVFTVPQDSFKRILDYWPLTGLLTGTTMATIYICIVSLGFGQITAILFAFASRVLLTGALHEDGLADFFDGFGGGRTREKVLAIMKDSHIGTYGVVGLLLYIALWITSMETVLQRFQGYEFIIFIACDMGGKLCATQIATFLPYAREEEEAKIKTSYKHTSPVKLLISILPLLLLLVMCSPLLQLGLLVPFITMWLLSGYMKRRIQGYTGDCCGATFLLCELSYIITIAFLWRFI